MIYGFYARFFKFTHNKWLSIFLSKSIYKLFLCIFILKKIYLKKKIVRMSYREALQKVESVYPDPKGRPQYNNREINDRIDLSIIIPVYNHKDIIRECIDSVLDQNTVFSYEVIIVDDGSSDGAREIVLEYKDHPHVEVILQNNQGIAGARNTGIDHSTGHYIMFVDCDDIVHNNIVQTLLEEGYGEDCDIVMCAHNLSKERNGKVYSVIPNINPDVNLLMYQNNDEIMNFDGLPWGKIYKREMWDKIRFFPGYWYEDSIIQFLLFTQCRRFKYIPEVMYEYKWYEQNYSHIQNNDKMLKTIDSYWLLLAILERYKELGFPKDAKLYTLLLTHVSIYYYQMIKGLDQEVIEALFILAAELVDDYSMKTDVKLPYVLKNTEKALKERNINLWKLSCMYQ